MTSVALGEVARLLSGGTPSKSKAEYWGGDIPWISAKDMKSLRLSDSEDHVTPEGLENGTRLAEPGSLLILVRGMTLLNDVPICVADRAVSFNQDVKAIVPREDVDARYILYAVLSAKPSLLAAVELAGHGTGRLPTDVLQKLPLRLPPLPEQRAIAEVLGALDDKIELNERMNATLDEMARALFKSWFVDFDPVRAKAAGRQPSHMDAATAALFPASFEDSPLGPIPAGWRVESLDSIADFLNGLALQKFPAESDDYLPVIKIAEMRRGYTAATGKSSADLDPKYIVNDGDTLFSWSGSLEVRLWTHGPGALNQHLFKVTSNAYPQWFYYHWTREHLPDFQAIAAGKATTMGHIQRHHLSDALVAVPPRPLLQAGTNAIGSLLGLLVRNGIESRTLADLRDALLPKLISGELRVGEVARAMEAAV